MKRVLHCLTLVMILACLSCSISAEEIDVAQVRDSLNHICGTFVYKHSLGCVAAELPDSTARYDPCLHFGSMFLGDSLSMHQARLGKPYATPPDPHGQLLSLYLLPTADTTDVPYLIVGAIEGIITSLQITGPPTTDAIQFNDIHLGDSISVVEEKIGPPSSTSLVEEVGATLWAYDPYPISIEIISGRVFSIRIYFSDEIKEALGLQ